VKRNKKSHTSCENHSQNNKHHFQQNMPNDSQFPKNHIDPATKSGLLQQARNMPWAAGYEIRRFLTYPYIRLLFAINGITWGRNWHIWGMPIIQRYRGSTINIGEGAYFRSWKSTNPLVPQHAVVLATRNATAQIIIGENVGLTGTTIVAAERIEIGNRVQIGANATIVDTDFHPLDPAERQADFLAGRHAPIVIEEDVFIGMGCMILKGVRIGAGSTIGAGSVVTKDIPPACVAAGNPAVIVKQLDQAHSEDR
jgi:acetyltransferase-like isoleucine patch superfamily enzyme